MDTPASQIIFSIQTFEIDWIFGRKSDAHLFLGPELATFRDAFLTRGTIDWESTLATHRPGTSLEEAPKPPAPHAPDVVNSAGPCGLAERGSSR